MKTKIVTFSSLMKMAMEAWQKRPEVYKRLIYTGTEQLLPSAWVRYADDCFELRGPRKKDRSMSEGHCRITPHIRDGKWISRYQLEVSRSKFPARVIHTYTPFRFVTDGDRPVGYSAYSPKSYVNLLNLDGSVAESVGWEPNRRATGDIEKPHVAIDEETGLHVTRSDLYAQRANAECELNWFPQACYKVDDWLASIDRLPQVDAVRMRDLAMRSLRAAASLVTKIPNAKVRIFSAGRREVNASRWAGASEPVHFKDAGSLDLPEVVLLWRDNKHQSGDWRFCYLSWRIPPHGCPDLYPQPGNASIACYPNHGNHRAYHRLRSKAPGYPEVDWTTKSVVKYDEEPVGTRPDAEATFADWAELPDHVQVRRQGDSKIVSCMTPGISFAMTPEEVALRVEEQVLMASLPVC